MPQIGETTDKPDLNADVKSVSYFADTDPSEAAENIKKADEVGLDPDGYAELKPELKEIEKTNSETIAAPQAVADRMVQSTQHASVIKPDLGTFDKLERYVKFGALTIQGKDLSRDMFNLSYKQAMGQPLSDDEDFELLSLNDQLRELNGKQEEYGHSFTESLPAEVLGAGYDFAQSLWEGRDLTLIGGGIGGVTGAVIGSPALLPGALAGAVTGAIKGASVGTLLGQARDTFRQSTGQVYNDLTHIIQGTDQLAKRERQKLARGAGILMGAAAFVPIGTVVNRIPLLRKIVNPRSFIKYAMSVEGSAIRRLMMDIGASGLAEGLEEGAQETIQIIASSMGETWDGSETSFIDGLNLAKNRWEENAERVGKAGLLGGIAGSALSGGLRATGATIEGAAGLVTSGQSSDADVDVETPPTPSDITGANKNLPVTVRGTRAIQLKIMLDQYITASKETSTNINLPQEMDEIRQQTFEDAGVTHVFVDKEELNMWAKDDEKAKRALETIDSSGVAQSEINAPIRIEIKKFLRLMEDHPVVSNFAKVNPEDPSANQWMARLEDAERQRQAFEGEPKEVNAKSTQLNARLGDDVVRAGLNDPNIPSEIKKDISNIRDRVIEEHNFINGRITKLSEENGDFYNSEEYIKMLKKRDTSTFKAIREVHALIEKHSPQPLSNTLEERIKDEDIFGEDDYHAQETFTEEMYDVIPKEESLKFNEAQLTARVEVADAINEAVNKKIEKIIDLKTQAQLLFEQELARGKAEDAPRIAMVEAFINNTKVIGDLTPEQQSKVDKGIPLYQINPESLTPAQRRQFADNENLKRRKVFSKDGMDVKAVASAFGVSPKELLLNLVTTPTVEEQVDSELAASKAEIEREIRGDTDLTEGRLAKAYNNMTKNHIQEMKVLLSKNWSSVKKGIKRISLPLPQMSQLISRARDQVGATKVKDLNANQWKVGERRSQRKAVNAILNNKVEEAFREKENAAYNTQLAKETHIAIGKVNRAFNFIASLGSDRVQGELKEAGKLYTDAVNYFLDLYNFDPSQRGQADIDSYNRFVKRMVEEGKGDFSIPSEVQEWLTTERSAKELTVDKVLFISDALKKIQHQARLKNKLLAKYVAEQDQATIEILEEGVNERAIKHPAYDRSRLEQPMTVGPFKKMANFFKNSETLIKNSHFLNLELDAGVEGEMFMQLIHQPIQGTGANQGPYGYQAKNKLQGKVQKKFLKIKKKYYGHLEFNNLVTVKVKVPEFNGVSIGDGAGNVTKADLLVMLMNMGNAENKQRMESYGINRDELMSILQRELKESDFDFVQEAVWGMYKSLKHRVASVHKVTTGVDVEFVQPESFEAFGKTYEGGYFPLRYRSDGNVSTLAQETIDELSSADPSKTKAVVPYNALEGVVRSPHTKERTGSEKLVNLDIAVFSQSIDEVLHDITMRVPVRDVMTLLKNKSISEDMISIIGREKYNTLVNLVALQTNSASSSNMRLFNTHQNFLTRTFSTIESSFAVNYILFNPSSVLMSTMAVPQIIRRMGVTTGGKHLAQAALKLANPVNIGKLKEMYAFAAEIDPSVTLFREGIDDFNSKAIAKYLPKKRLIPGKTYNFLKATQEKATEFGFSGILGGIDTMMKVTTAIAAYNQYLAGDAPGKEFTAIRKGKTDQQLHDEAKAYASSVVESTIMRAGQFDKAVLQNIPLGKIVTRFWNEMRGNLNTTIQDTRNIKHSANDMVNKVKSGDLLGASLAFQDSSERAARMIMMSMLGMVIIGIARDRNPFPTDKDEREEDLDLEEQIQNIPEWMGHTLTTADGLGALTAEMFGNNIPVVRDMLFSAESGRGLSFPLVKAAQDIGTTAFAITPLMYHSLMDDMTLMEAAEGLKSSEIRAMLNTVGYAVGGIPISGVTKLMGAIDEREEEIDLSFINQDFLKNLDSFLQRNEKELTDEEYMARLMGENPERSEFDQAVDTLREIKEFLNPLPDGDPLTDDAYEIIKHAESNGSWKARPSGSSAFGLYQFTEDTWNRVMATPEGRAAGLTLTGRLSRNPKQQEKAMRILTKMNVSTLRRDKVPINIESVYFAHHFGPRFAAEVYKKPDKTKLSKRLLTSGVLKANPRLAETKVKTAGDMKRYIRDALARGQKSLEQSRN